MRDRLFLGASAEEADPALVASDQAASRLAPTGVDPLRIELGWPAKELWPNGGTPHHMVLHRFKKAAKIEAGWATKFVMSIKWHPTATPIPVHLIAHPKPVGPHPDRDNLIASLKAHFDGIAAALGVNDRDFAAPTVEFADRCQNGKIIVCVG